MHGTCLQHKACAPQPGHASLASLQEHASPLLLSHPAAHTLPWHIAKAGMKLLLQQEP